jgi:hypothetical protein
MTHFPETVGTSPLIIRNGKWIYNTPSEFVKIPSFLANMKHRLALYSS